MQEIRIGTRGSQLALWQADHVAGLLSESDSGLKVEIVPIKTEGDRRQDVSLSEIGGKGLFIKELEYALLERKIDIAVHSMKDVTVHMEPEFCIPVILNRANPFDALVSVKYDSLQELPESAIIGTCSLRRQSQLLSIRPDLQIISLRGNVPTRLNRLDSGKFDAIVLAVSGLQRLGLEHRITQILSSDAHLPSPGQGALGIQCRTEDTDTQELIGSLNDQDSHTAVSAERVANSSLGGSCYVPVGIYATIQSDRINICGFVGSPDGSRTVHDSNSGTRSNSERLACDLATALKNQGAQEILDACEQR